MRSRKIRKISFLMSSIVLISEGQTAPVGLTDYDVRMCL